MTKHYGHGTRRGCGRGATRVAWRGSTFLLVPLVLLVQSVAASADGDVAATEQAGDFLRLESVPDGRCQILSEGGKLRILRNVHAGKPIAYRLLRVFAGDHAQGLSTGVAPPGGEGVKLGCTRVDGREQDWIVQRARFE